MDTSIFIAKLLGLYLVVVGISFLINRKSMTAAFDAMLDDQGMLLVLAIITFFIGTLLILTHNIWVADWRGLVTVIGWLIFFKGAIRLIFPGFDRVWRKPIKNAVFYYLCAIVTLGLGAYLLYIVYQFNS